MSHKLIPIIVATGLTWLASGSAWARQPPSVVEQQEAAASVLGQCPPTAASRGYRDRFLLGAESRRLARYVAARRKMADHSVITCASETVHTGGGYRDIFVRLQPESTSLMVAALCPR